MARLRRDCELKLGSENELLRELGRFVQRVLHLPPATVVLAIAPAAPGGMTVQSQPDAAAADSNPPPETLNWPEVLDYGILTDYLSEFLSPMS